MLVCAILELAGEDSASGVSLRDFWASWRGFGVWYRVVLVCTTLGLAGVALAVVLVCATLQLAGEVLASGVGLCESRFSWRGFDACC